MGQKFSRAALFQARKAVAASRAASAKPAASSAAIGSPTPAAAPPAADASQRDFGWPWAPKFPDWAKPIGDADTPVKSELPQAVWWVLSPQSSHIAKYRFRIVNGTPELRVQFRANPKSKHPLRIAEYMYTWPSSQADAARSIFRQMQSSAHPYGEVLYPRVIKAGVSYRPVAVSS